MQLRIVRAGLTGVAFAGLLTLGLTATSEHGASAIPRRAKAPTTTATTQDPSQTPGSELPLKPDTVPSTSPPAKSPPAAPDALPATGFDAGETGLVGAALVGAGVLVLAARRRTVD